MPDALAQLDALDWLTLLWMTALGGIIGSFLNVVVHRLPRGESLSYPPSHCPACGHAIRWHDNVPVLGWLMLRGRCRDCRAPISSRYPLVEGLTAATFLLLALLEIVLRGINLPEPLVHTSREVVVSGGARMLYGTFLYHQLLLGTLLAAGLIQLDRLPREDTATPPSRVFWPVMIGGVMMPIIWPRMHPVHAWPGLAGMPLGLIDTAAGAAAGLALGWLAARLEIRGRRVGLTWALTAVGIVLGWQAIVVLTLSTGLWLLVRAGIQQFAKRAVRIPALLAVFTMTLAWICLWRQMADWLPLM